MHLEVRRFLRANSSTLLATALEWGLVSALVRAQISYLIAAGIGATVGAVMDFSIKRRWAFLRHSMRSLHAESGRYLVVSALSLGWNLLVSFTFVHFMHLPPIPGVIAASVIVGVLWNYPMHRLLVFRDVLTPDLHSHDVLDALAGATELTVEGTR